MNLKKIITSIAIFAGISTQAQYINWHNEAADTITINNLLKDAVKIPNPEERIFSIAQNFIDTPYKAGTLESPDGEKLTINLDEVDCTTLIDNIIALAITAGEKRTSWRDFLYNLERLRYRKGIINGYASRLHYISDWIVDNVHRGNFIEATPLCDFVSYEIKTLNFMSANRNLYPALADSATFAKIKEAEIGFRNHKFSYIKSSRVNKAAKSFLHTGDIIAICTGKKGLDVSHMGILFIDEEGTPFLLHASSKAGKVILDTTPLVKYLNNNRLPGIRVIRINK